MIDIVVEFIGQDSIPVVDSRVIALDMDIDHGNFMETIYTYQNEIESLGSLIFDKEKTGTRGRPQKFAWLNEDQAIFLMTLSSNTDRVVSLKLKLTKSFKKARELARDNLAKKSYVPYWYQRMKVAYSDPIKPLPSGHFCIYQRMMDLFYQLEARVDYIIPDISPKTKKHLIPDISIGKMFNDFLRSEDEVAVLARQKFLGSSLPIDFRPNGSHSTERAEYNHVYPESSHGKYKTQSAYAYPIEYSSIFDYYFSEYWISDRAVRYLEERDPEGVRQIQTKLSQFPSEIIASLQGTLLGKLIRALPPTKI